MQRPNIRQWERSETSAVSFHPRCTCNHVRCVSLGTAVGAQKKACALNIEEGG